MHRIISWFVDNSVAANLLMWILLIGGGIALMRTHQEEFPNIDVGMVQVNVPYLGAAPQEVERGVCIRIEEAIEGTQGVDRMESTASEGACSVAIVLTEDVDSSEALNEIKGKVDAINTFPAETEKPIVSKFAMRGGVLQIAITGNASELTLKRVGQELRDDIAAISGVSQVELDYVRPYEISIEVSEYTLRRHGLTLTQVANAIRRASLDMPGGSLKTEGGEILLRTTGQAYRGEEFERIVVLTRVDGTRVTVGEVANVVDGFQEGDLAARFDGKPAVMVKVYRVGEEDIIAIADTVQAFVTRAQTRVPPGIDLVIWMNQSQGLIDRVDTLMATGFGGLALVLLTLTLFLKFGVAIWVAAGIPIALAGAVMIFPYAGISISTLAVMAFILVLGIVVDDAIVVGERVYAHEQLKKSRTQAAVDGTYEVSIPVIFGVLTTIAAFLPLIMVEGRMAQFFGVIGWIVILALIFSIVESQMILPVHLSHRREWLPNHPVVKAWNRFQGKFANALTSFASDVYRPFLQKALWWRYVTAAIAFGVLVSAIALIVSGRVVFQFFPSIEGDRVYATLTMPEGVLVARTVEAVKRIEAAVPALREELDAEYPAGTPSMIKHMFSSVGRHIDRGRGPSRRSGGP
ncbi:MAG: efflux RND transporter permease subunit, partial [Gammaproteobacteria bacterium]|nr:efflux RND transporter permease subunit [Gammaproteobacteria bacterium]